MGIPIHGVPEETLRSNETRFSIKLAKYAAFDIDGTLADSRHRIHYLNPPNGVKKTGPSFYRVQ